MSIDNCLWTPTPDQAAATHVEQFRHRLNERYELSLNDYAALHRWSVNESERFWSELWDYAGIQSDLKGKVVLENAYAMPGARWFPEARLNYAQNLLSRRDDSIALIFQGEQGGKRCMTHAELYREVCAVAQGLRQVGVRVGDRVAGFLPNIPEAVVAMLAASSVGAVWSSCSPDFGINGVRDRFGQIEPKVLFTADGYRYAGKDHESLGIVSELAESLSELEAIVIIPFLGTGKQMKGRAGELSVYYQQWTDTDNTTEVDSEIVFAQLPFDHPLYIMFSSGTTGKPKCIVHGAGGTLLQHIKEHLMHVDVREGDRLFFFTTCGWMMWNWLVSALASRAKVLLYDGSPFYPDGNTLFDYAQASDVTQFGTSAKFIDACSKAGLSPKKTHRLPALRSVLSTGSPLVPESFDYVYEHIADNICLASMSGGTDIMGCFVLGNPAAPVYRGELQAKALAMDVQVYDENGRPVPAGVKGELVCTRPFPSMPTGFFADEDGSRYHAAYFDKFDNVWCHGDYVTETETGGMIFFGRSDAVLNPGGVRIGTAEIYRQVESFDEVIEALVIGQRWESDLRIVLFVRLRDALVLDDELRNRIRAHVREQTTPRHVPSRIVQVADIPRTRSGKIVELAVRKVVHGEAIDNIEALANPEALKLFENLAELRA